jgi:tetratricopeptide (TPR) repeat protein
LNKSSAQTFNDKVNLIYEYNKESPLFVRVANNEIDKNNVEKAVEILNEGLTVFPRYSVAHIVLGKALMHLGKYKEALDSFRTGSELVNSSRLYDYYLHEVENIKKQRALFESSRKPGFVADKTDGTAELPKKINLEDELSSFDSMDSPTVASSIPKQGSDSIVSETLANIYITQGEFREALTIFEKLLNKNPQKKDYYQKKIDEINAELE